MKRIFFGIIPLALLLIGLFPIVSALDPFTTQETLEPMTFTGYPVLPSSQTESIDIVIESDVPVNIYILSSTEVYSLVSMMNASELLEYDGAEDVIDSIAEGGIAATVMQYPRLMARTAAEYAHEYIRNGKRDFPPKIPVNVDLVTAENIREFTAYGKKE